MGVPIPHYKDEPLNRRKGFFGLTSSSAIVGVSTDAVLQSQPQCWSSFIPILQFPGSVVCDLWRDITLHFIYGPTQYGGLYFQIKPSHELVFLGTHLHGRLPSPESSLPFHPLLFDHPPSDQVITRGFIEWQEWIPGDSDSEDGFHELPACFLGGEISGPIAEDVTPACICCKDKMRYVGTLETEAFSDDIPSATMLLYYCERDEVECIIGLE